MSVVACPKCGEEVSVPHEAPREAKVRCPLCAEVYQLYEALVALPPMLEIVEMPEGYIPPRNHVMAEEQSFARAAVGSPDSFSRAAFGRSLSEVDEDQADLALAGAGSAPPNRRLLRQRPRNSSAASR